MKSTDTGNNGKKRRGRPPRSDKAGSPGKNSQSKKTTGKTDNKPQDKKVTPKRTYKRKTPTQKKTPPGKKPSTDKRTINSSKAPTEKVTNRSRKKSLNSSKTVIASNKGKKRSYKNNRKKSFISFSTFMAFSIVTFFVMLIVFLLLYIFVFFPGRLNERIENDLSEVYNPVILESTKNLFILKLSSRPTQNLQESAYNTVKKNYDLELKFEKVSSSIDKGINRLHFAKYGKPFSGLKDIYIYWDKDIVRTQVKNKNIITKNGSKESIPQQKKTTIEKTVHKNTKSYADVEEKRQKEKKDKVVIHKPEKVQVNKQVAIKEVKSRVKETPRVVKGKIAIVIDDVGYSYNSTYDFLSLGFPVTFAIIPDMSHSDHFYKLIRESKYDMLLHIPMEPLSGKNAVESNALFTDMDTLELKSRMEYFLNKYPAVIGANNHMGSKAVTDATLMKVVIDELKKRNKLWLDSMTNSGTVSKEIASIANYPIYQRDVFLDNDDSYEAIRRQMLELVKVAKENGYAVGIGHIQSAMLARVLKEFYNNRKSYEVEFVGLRSL